MTTLHYILISLALSCAGCQQFDTAFRSRVESAEFTAAGTGDKAGNYGGTIGTKLNFRDPHHAGSNK